MRRAYLNIPEDVEGWRRGGGHDAYAILQGFMESVALAIKDGTLVQHEADGVYIDLFGYPPKAGQPVVDRVL